MDTIIIREDKRMEYNRCKKILFFWEAKTLEYPISPPNGPNRHNFKGLIRATKPLNFRMSKIVPVIFKKEVVELF